MPPEVQTFRDRDLRGVMTRARRTLGEDAMILRTRQLGGPGDAGRVEVLAAPPAAIRELERHLEGPWAGRPAGTDATGAERPRVVALTGPSGVGKTTMAARLALHPRAAGGPGSALLTLDTYRVAAVEQLGAYAEASGLPLEVVYHADEAPAALDRLAGRDTVVVDTPGRAPDGPDGDWSRALRALEPDEVHLVLPAHLDPAAGADFRERWAAAAPTHLSVTKLDEAPDDGRAASLPLRLGMPCRWVADGEAVPDGLRVARDRLGAALGLGDGRREGRDAADRSGRAEVA